MSGEGILSKICKMLRVVGSCTMNGMARRKISVAF